MIGLPQEVRVKLYNSNLSPYASRVRVQVYAKGLKDVELVEPPDGTASDAYRKITPIGKVPSLEVDGQVIPESEVIVEYLEDRFPTPALRPADPAGRARTRLLARLADLYVSPVLGRLFAQMDPSTRDAKALDAALTELGTGLDRIEAYIAPGPYAAGGSLTTADAALAPFFFFLTSFLPRLGASDVFKGRPRTQAWWTAVQKDPHVGRVLGEMADDMKRRFSG
jgi:glutathione S-transferase